MSLKDHSKPRLIESIKAGRRTLRKMHGQLQTMAQNLRAAEDEAANWKKLAMRLLELHPETGTLEFLCETWDIELEVTDD